jgi:hypothetical protein
MFLILYLYIACSFMPAGLNAVNNFLKAFHENKTN